MQEAEDDRLLEEDVRLLGKEADSCLDVLLIGEVDFLRQEEAFLHRDGEVRNTLHTLLPLVSDSPLWQPDAVYKA